MGINNWEAKWINPELVIDKKNRQPASYLKKEFVIDKLGKSRLYITAHGLYEVSINGNRVGDFILAPGTDDYHKRLQYQIYDVKHLIKEGINVIEVATTLERQIKAKNKFDMRAIALGQAGKPEDPTGINGEGAVQKPN